MMHSNRPKTRVHLGPAARRASLGGLAGAVLCLLAMWLWAPVVIFAGEPAPERQEEIVAARINRVLPGVVGTITEVSAEVTVRCGPKDTYVVKLEANRENGTGFIIHPDGWIATNGYVVEPAYTADEDHVADFLAAAADATCGAALAKLPESERKARRHAIFTDPENLNGVQLTKKLEVVLPTVPRPGSQRGGGIPAVVKAYSPPEAEADAVQSGLSAPRSVCALRSLS